MGRVGNREPKTVFRQPIPPMPAQTLIGLTLEIPGRWNGARVDAPDRTRWRAKRIGPQVAVIRDNDRRVHSGGQRIEQQVGRRVRIRRFFTPPSGRTPRIGRCERVRPHHPAPSPASGMWDDWPSPLAFFASNPVLRWTTNLPSSRQSNDPFSLGAATYTFYR